jgi:hypothetical protein
MMKLGFQLTGTSKRQKLVSVVASSGNNLTGEAKVSLSSSAANDDNDDDEFTRVDMIKSIEENNIHSLEPLVEKKPLIIPLIPARSFGIKDDGPGLHGSQQDLLGGVSAHHSSSSTVRMKHEAVVDSNSVSTNAAIDKNSDSTSAAIDSVKLEDLATIELLQELKTEGNGDSLYSRSNLVIKSNATTTTHPDDDSAHSGSHGGGGIVKRKAPLLMLHVAPELLQIRDETERFRYDMSHRADDVSIRSEAYEHVPIEEFGAALLRGMGWKEEVDTAVTRSSSSKKGIDDGNSNRGQLGSSRMMPRERNLGLGAMPKPPALSGSHGHSKDKDKDLDRRKDKEALDSQWRHKVSDRILNQRIAEGDVVWVIGTSSSSSSSSASSLAGQRGLVVAATGVAGLDRIR